MTYIPLFKNQHDLIFQKIETSEQHWSLGEKNLCLSELKSLKDLLIQHHDAERQHFFLPLRDLPKMNQGGPFCSYFFEFFMNNRPLLMTETFISENRNKVTLIPIPSVVESFFSTGSLLAIPIEEHLACEAVCEELIQTLENLTPKAGAWVTKALSFLKDLITTNHRKEETCLWIAAGNALEPAHYQQLMTTMTLKTGPLDC